MQIAVVDGMGGGLGAQITSYLADELPESEIEIIALGTNARATSRLLKAGADRGASRDNAIKVMCEKVDVIVGPVGIMIPNSMMGEISPETATVIASSKAEKFLLAVHQPHFQLTGTRDEPLNVLMKELIAEVKDFVLTEEPEKQ